ncbi:unnamed protein product [Ilex paraguariensis]|uniref:Uncharacterized protein n=1 Tax=Ilex paraguariensis TaxID=185542 RepID=A0ABC8RRU9_9AQUA
MRGSVDGRRPPRKLSPATTSNKRKHSPIAKHSQSRRRHDSPEKRILISETNTLAVNRTLHTCTNTNSFAYKQTSSYAYAHRKSTKQHRRKKAESTDGHRKWVYSTRDCSNFKGFKRSMYVFSFTGE